MLGSPYPASSVEGADKKERERECEWVSERAREIGTKMEMGKRVR